MKFTRGEARGVLILGILLVALLALVAWHRARRDAEVVPACLPAEIKVVADSLSLRDSLSGIEPLRPGEMPDTATKIRPAVSGKGKLQGGKMVRERKSGSAMVPDRGSPLDEPVD